MHKSLGYENLLDIVLFAEARQFLYRPVRLSRRQWLFAFLCVAILGIIAQDFNFLNAGTVSKVLNNHASSLGRKDQTSQTTWLPTFFKVAPEEGTSRLPASASSYTSSLLASCLLQLDLSVGKRIGVPGIAPTSVGLARAEWRISTWYWYPKQHQPAARNKASRRK